MLKFTQGAPDEMQVLIACGIATYLMAFPLVILCAIVCGAVMNRTQSGEPTAARTPGEGYPTGPAHQREAGAAASRTEAGVGAAA